MPVCAIKLCKNHSTRNKKDSGITYHRFPVDPVISDRWTSIVRFSRQESWWKPGSSSIICSKHFNENDFYRTKRGLKKICKGAVPRNVLLLSTISSDKISSNGTLLNNNLQPNITNDISCKSTIPKKRTASDKISSTSTAIKKSSIGDNSFGGKTTDSVIIKTEPVIVKIESIEADPPHKHSKDTNQVNLELTTTAIKNATTATGTGNPSPNNITEFLVLNTQIKKEPIEEHYNTAANVESGASNNISVDSASVSEIEPSTSDVQNTMVAIESEIPLSDDFSDTDSVFDTPKEAKLRRELRRKTALQFKHARIIKSLREKIRRLKKTVCSLKTAIKSIKHD